MALDDNPTTLLKENVMKIIHHKNLATVAIAVLGMAAFGAHAGEDRAPPSTARFSDLKPQQAEGARVLSAGPGALNVASIR